MLGLENRRVGWILDLMVKVSDRMDLVVDLYMLVQWQWLAHVCFSLSNGAL